MDLVLGNNEGGVDVQFKNFAQTVILVLNQTL